LFSKSGVSDIYNKNKPISYSIWVYED